MRTEACKYVYNHCNIRNISIYFCNIYLKLLQHTFKISEALETYACNMLFSTLFRTTQSRMETAGSGQPATEEGDTAWQRPATPVPGPVPTSDIPLSWSPGHTQCLGACAVLLARLAQPTSGTDEHLDPSGSEEAHRLVGGSRGKQATRWRRLRRAGSAGVAMEKAGRRSGDIVKASSFLKVVEVVQQACWPIPRA
jgi:hypothetical protein